MALDSHTHHSHLSLLTYTHHRRAAHRRLAQPFRCDDRCCLSLSLGILLRATLLRAPPPQPRETAGHEATLALADRSLATAAIATAAIATAAIATARAVAAAADGPTAEPRAEPGGGAGVSVRRERRVSARLHASARGGYSLKAEACPGAVTLDGAALPGRLLST